MEVLGAVAASLQLGGLAIKGSLEALELLNDLKELPERFAKLLRHLDREVTSINGLLRTDSAIYNHLTNDQYIQLSSPATEARKAIDELRALLQPLVDIKQTGGKTFYTARLKTLARSFKSLAMEKDVEVKISSIERLNMSLLRQLQFCGFETQSLVRNGILEIQKNQDVNRDLQKYYLPSISNGLVQTNENLANIGAKIESSAASFAHVSRIVTANQTEAITRFQATSERIEDFLRSRAIESRNQTIEDRAILLDDIRKLLEAACAEGIRRDSHLATTPASSPFELDTHKRIARYTASHYVLHSTGQPACLEGSTHLLKPVKLFAANKALPNGWNGQDLLTQALVNAYCAHGDIINGWTSEAALNMAATTRGKREFFPVNGAFGPNEQKPKCSIFDSEPNQGISDYL
ncbi:hypothetical protein S40285_09825 [Stachybotrys chlorohalonatus IBT 40285]|uniref:Fungal N-terminal domain-containing protein n=1 Tax=Stachybotrys chlorohalonatus (strain IBT 40285) TaxID=1283841 RepID=A0A084QYU9_STAC4|nr:hypothetical protein S40285_09825 [Stachybotrys chlorohalonata IBT 40285]